MSVRPRIYSEPVKIGKIKLPKEILKSESFSTQT